MNSISGLHKKTTILLKRLGVIISMVFVVLASFYFIMQILGLNDTTGIWIALFQNRIKQIEKMADNNDFEIKYTNYFKIDADGSIADSTDEDMIGIRLNKTGLFGKIYDTPINSIKIVFSPDLADGIQRVHFIKRYPEYFAVYSFDNNTFFPEFSIINAELAVEEDGVIWYSSNFKQIGNVFRFSLFSFRGNRVFISSQTSINEIQNAHVSIKRDISTDALIFVLLLSLLVMINIFFKKKIKEINKDYSTLIIEESALNEYIERTAKSISEEKAGEIVLILSDIKNNRSLETNFTFIENSTYKHLIEDLVDRIIALLNEINENNLILEKRLKQTLNALSKTSETRDRYTAGHQKNVMRLACALAQELGLTKEIIDNISIGAMIFDIGKNSIPYDILHKPGKLTDLEYRIVKTHVDYSLEIVKEIDLPEEVYKMIYQHHERLDGSGYPQGISGDELSIESRVLAVADVFDALISYRPYRPALSVDMALEELQLDKGVKYDSSVVDACIRLIREKNFNPI